MTRVGAASAILLFVYCISTAGEGLRAIDAEIIVEAPIGDVWAAWTTPEGIRSFLAPAANIDLRPGGRYEILFAPEKAPGLRGTEGCIILAVDPEKMLSFTWNSPPSLPEVRPQFTHVTLRFEAIGKTRTRLRFHQDGWGEGRQWDDSYAYFTRAWKEVVLPALQKRFASGGANGP
jgi:uncharacterized protein YndB with AHSA1/START domain